jgi:hypothetical protein
MVPAREARRRLSLPMQHVEQQPIDAIDKSILLIRTSDASAPTGDQTYECGQHRKCARQSCEVCEETD